MMSPTLQPIRAAAAATFRPLEEGGVLLHVGTGAYFELNSSGRFIWETIEKGTDRRSLTAALAAQYHLDESDARADIEEFLAELDKRSLLDFGPPDDSE